MSAEGTCSPPPARPPTHPPGPARLRRFRPAVPDMHTDPSKRLAVRLQLLGKKKLVPLFQVGGGGFLTASVCFVRTELVLVFTG